MTAQENDEKRAQESLARASFTYANKRRYGIDDGSVGSVAYSCPGLKFRCQVNECPYEKIGKPLDPMKITEVTKDWKLADYLSGVITRRLELAHGVKTFSPAVVDQEMGFEEAGKAYAIVGPSVR